MEDESGDQFVAYFLPTEDTLRKRKREENDNEHAQSDDELVKFLYFVTAK